MAEIKVRNKETGEVITLREKGISATTQEQPQEKKSFLEPFKQAGNMALKGIANAPQEGMMNAIAGGPAINIQQAIKRAALNNVMPSQDLISNSLKEAIVEGTNPVNIFSAYLGTKAGANKLKQVVDLGGDKSVKKIAIQANRSLNRVHQEFARTYDSIMEKSGDKKVPVKIKGKLGLVASDALEQTSPGTPINTYLDKNLQAIFNSESLTAKELHSLKGKIFKQAKSAIGTEKNALMKVYDAINESLADEKLAGIDYANVTANYGSFMRNESGYVEDMIFDKLGKLTSEKLNKKGLLGLGLPAKLTDNTKEAFSRLSNRKTSTTNILKDLESVRMGELIKKVALGASIVSIPGVRPAMRSVPGEVRGMIERN